MPRRTPPETPTEPARKRAGRKPTDLAAVRAEKARQGVTPKTRPRNAAGKQLELREARAINLLIAGFSYQQIADDLAMTYDGVRTLVDRVLTRERGQYAKDRDTWRQVLTMRAEQLLHVWMPAALGINPKDPSESIGDPSLKAAEFVDRLLGRLARLHHLELPMVAVPAGDDAAPAMTAAAALAQLALMQQKRLELSAAVQAQVIEGDTG